MRYLKYMQQLKNVREVTFEEMRCKPLTNCIRSLLKVASNLSGRLSSSEISTFSDFL